MRLQAKRLPDPMHGSDGVMPVAAAIERTLQCVASRGVDSSVLTTTASTWSSVIRRGAPLRGSSNNALTTPSATKRDRHLPTVALVSRSSRATWLLEQPSLHRNTISARTASPWARLASRGPAFQRRSVLGAHHQLRQGAAPLLGPIILLASSHLLEIITHFRNGTLGSYWPMP